MKGTWDMARSEIIDYRRFYEADSFRSVSVTSKEVLMVKEQLFSTSNRDVIIPFGKGELLIVDCSPPS
jgi:hypothetical protein